MCWLRMAAVMTDYLQGTHFNGPEDLVGQIVPVLITGAGRNSLTGELA